MYTLCEQSFMHTLTCDIVVVGQLIGRLYGCKKVHTLKVMSAISFLLYSCRLSMHSLGNIVQIYLFIIWWPNLTLWFLSLRNIKRQIVQNKCAHFRKKEEKKCEEISSISQREQCNVMVNFISHVWYHKCMENEGRKFHNLLVWLFLRVY